MMRETYRQVTEQLQKYPEECERLEKERIDRLSKRYNKTQEARY